MLQRKKFVKSARPESSRSETLVQDGVSISRKLWNGRLSSNLFPEICTGFKIKLHPVEIQRIIFSISKIMESYFCNKLDCKMGTINTRRPVRVLKKILYSSYEHFQCPNKGAAANLG